VPPLDELPADVRERIEQVGERTGFVPNVFLALARRPAESRAFVARLAHLMALRPNPEFHLLGRVPRES
jgi:hypothetical protein